MRNTTSRTGGSRSVRPARRAAWLAAAALFAAAACAGNTPRRQASAPAGAQSPSTATTGRPMGNREITGENATRLEELFAGRFAGVQVYPAGGGVRLHVRSTSPRGGEPLFVLDGQPLAPGHGGVLDVNPNDIARIEVVRSAADLAVWGSRGGYGVVKITTRRGQRPN